MTRWNKRRILKEIDLIEQKLNDWNTYKWDKNVEFLREKLERLYKMLGE